MVAPKNIWLSLYLSGANTWAGATRSFWSAEYRRQQQAMLHEMMTQAAHFWAGSGFPSPVMVPSRRRRR